MLYFHTMLGSSVCMHGNFHTPKSICRHARVKCLHAWKFPYTQKYMPCWGQVFACMEISIHPKVYGSSVCLHGNFHTPKSICRAWVKCLHAWKFPCTQKYMPCLGQVFACMEISIHPKVYAVLGSSVCIKCLHAWKFPYTQKYMPCLGQVFACMEISIHPKVYAVLGSSVCMHGNFHTPKSIRVKCLPAWKFPYTQKYMPCLGQVFACMEISIHPKVYAVLGSSVCMHGNFHTPKSLCRSVCMLGNFHTPKSVCRSVCMLGNFHTPKSVHMPCTGQLLHEFLHAGVYWKLQKKKAP